MDVGVAGAVGKQVAADKVNPGDGERQFRRLNVPSGAVPVARGATSPRSSYRQMGMEGPLLRRHALPRERPVETFAEVRERLAARSHPENPGRAALRERPHAGKPDLEGIHHPKRPRRGHEPGQPVRRHVSHEAQGDVKAPGRNPAHAGQGLARGSQRPPQPAANRVRRPHSEEQAPRLQPTRTAAGRSALSTPRTAASTSLRDDAHPSEKRTAPSSVVPSMACTSGAQCSPARV